ncbi:type II toxin-antitoxin system VapC family toxin [Leifsonia sp. NPDC058230]|uniref:type II toxin-antitoxin system VapC family toxin n=1 Tax=Leifsonia sp. NPDC058230 TaxID=3346391 RepID=UPI0036D8C2E7
MTRYVIDARVAIRLAVEEREIAEEHELLAPTLIRSQTLSLLHTAAVRGEITKRVAENRLDRIGAMRIRLLGDRVLRSNAWKVADRLGWSDTYDAEYIALTVLQADAFITLDAELAASVEGVVRTAPIDDLFRANG